MFTLGGILGAAVAAWFAGRAHLRQTQLKGLEKVIHVPVGTLSTAANQATETLSGVAGNAAAHAVDQKIGSTLEGTGDAGELFK